MTRRKLDDAEPTGALVERQRPDGRRRIKLNKKEKFALVRSQRAEAAAALFLDLRESRTWNEIATELGLSPAQLRDLTKTKEFDEAYNALFAELGHDPRYRAAQAAISDMLPLAIRELKSMIVSTQTPAGTRFKAIEKIIALNGLEAKAPQGSDRQEYVKFLVEHKINVSEVQVPPEYEQAMANVIDGEIRDVEEA